MKIVEWGVEDYKSIETGEFELGEFTVLIGKNNSGKSNILQSFQDFKGKHDTQTGRNSLSDQWLIERVTGKEESQGFEIRIRFALSEETHQEVIDQIEESVRSTPARTPSPEEMLEWGWLSEVQYNVEYNSDGTVDVERLINYDEEDVSLDDLVGTQKVHGANFRNLINNKVDEFIQNWEFVDPFREPKDVQNAHYMTNLDSKGDNLVRVLDSLSRNHPRVFEKISDTYIDIMEGVSDLRVEYDTDTGGRDALTIVVEEENYENRFKSEDISSGSKEILVLITHIYLAQEFADLLVIEEPELHVHPEAENKLYSIMEDIAGGDGPQIIVSTHSDVFVNQSDVSNIVRVEREGDTTLRTISEEEIGQELAELGYDKSGLLQSEAVVFVEGRSDKRILKRFADTVGLDLDSQGVSVVELEGIENMKRDAKSLVKLLHSFDIPYLFLRDKHNLGREEAEGKLYDAMKRDDGDHWWDVSRDNIYVWDAYGIESYLLVSRAISAELDMDQEEIEEIIDANEDVDNKEEVLKELYAEENSDLDEPNQVYAKGQHGMRIAKQMRPEEVPDEVVDVVIQIGELVDGWDPESLNVEHST